MGVCVKIACVGGGPASLYFSILMKRQDPSHDIIVHERNPAGSTYGWGVTYWSELLDRLREKDPETALAISENTVRFHLKSAFEKLGVDDRAHAVAVALQRGILRLD